MLDCTEERFLLLVLPLGEKKKKADALQKNY